MSYKNYAPMAAKFMLPDGTITDNLPVGNGGEITAESMSNEYKKRVPMAAKFLLPDGTITDKMPTSGGGGDAPGNDTVGSEQLKDGAVTTPKLAQEVITRIDQYKFIPLSGNGNDANQLTNEGIYFNSGGYGLHNAPRNVYGWMLIVSHGSSNGHPQGAQLYLDAQGFDYRGFNGSTFTEWETFIIKNKVEHLEPIADPASATIEDMAKAHNDLLTALKG